MQTELVESDITENKDEAVSNDDELGCQDIFDSLSLSTDRRESFYFQHDRESPLSRSFRTPSNVCTSSEEQGGEENVVSHLCLQQRPRSADAQDRLLPPSTTHTAHSSSTDLTDGTAGTVASNRRASTEGFTTPMDAHPTACRQPIDLTRLLNRCEGDVELLSEVSIIPAALLPPLSAS